MKTNNKKSFDAVKMMREIRNRISKETGNMTFAQLKKYIEQHIKEGELKLVGH